MAVNHWTTGPLDHWTIDSALKTLYARVQKGP